MGNELTRTKNYIALAGVMFLISSIIGFLSASGNAPVDMIIMLAFASNAAIVLASVCLVLAGITLKK